MSGGLLPAKRIVVLSTYSRNGTCCFLILTFGFFAWNALMSSVQYSPAPGSSICHEGNSSSMAFGWANAAAANAAQQMPSAHRLKCLISMTAPSHNEIPELRFRFDAES